MKFTAARFRSVRSQRVPRCLTAIIAAFHHFHVHHSFIFFAFQLVCFSFFNTLFPLLHEQNFCYKTDKTDKTMYKRHTISLIVAMISKEMFIRLDFINSCLDLKQRPAVLVQHFREINRRINRVLVMRVSGSCARGRCSVSSACGQKPSIRMQLKTQGCSRRPFGGKIEQPGKLHKKHRKQSAKLAGQRKAWTSRAEPGRQICQPRNSFKEPHSFITFSAMQSLHPRKLSKFRFCKTLCAGKEVARPKFSYQKQPSNAAKYMLYGPYNVVHTLVHT